MSIPTDQTELRDVVRAKYGRGDRNDRARCQLLRR